MADTLQELSRYLVAAATEVLNAVEGNDMERAKVSSREVLSAGSKLHQRLGILVDMSREARWVAAVDRAAPKPPVQLPGQLTIGDALRNGAGPKPRSAGPRKPRKPKG